MTKNYDTRRPVDWWNVFAYGISTLVMTYIAVHVVMAVMR